MKTNQYSYLLLLCFVVISCTDNKEKIQGEWFMLYNDNISEKANEKLYNTLPYYFRFSGDSCKAINDYNFTNSYHYRFHDDSLLLLKQGEVYRKFKVEELSDSSVTIGGATYHKKKWREEILPEFSLIDVRTALTLESLMNKFPKQSRFGSMLLAKINGETKMMIYDSIEDIEDSQIIQYLECSHCKRPTVPILFLGEGITLDDLIKVYQEFLCARVNNVILVTYQNKQAELFGFIDGAAIDVDSFVEKGESGWCPEFLNLGEQHTKIQISNKDDLAKLDSLSDTSIYYIEISPKADVITYLKAKQETMSRKNLWGLIRNF